jgi:hypothetical protein
MATFTILISDEGNSAVKITASTSGGRLGYLSRRGTEEATDAENLFAELQEVLDNNESIRKVNKTPEPEAWDEGEDLEFDSLDDLLDFLLKVLR